MQLEIRDRQGIKPLRYNEAVKYHGRHHLAGVALGWKLLEGVLSRCDGIPSRDSILLTVGATPPGVTDCLEYATRAFSRRRAIVDEGFMGGPRVCCGSLSFAFRCTEGRILATVRDNVLPRQVVDTAIRIDAGMADDEDIAYWRKSSQELAGQIMKKSPESLFLFTPEESIGEPPDRKEVEARPADYTLPDLPPIKVQDDNGVIEIMLDEMITFHDKDHFAGVVLAYKMLSLAFEELWGDEIPHRKDITILSGLNPPGLMDSFEYVARAVTRQQHCLLTNLNGAPSSPFGSFVFRVSNGGLHCNLRLRQGLLPDDFTSVGRKAEAGLANETETATWNAYKRDIGKTLADMEPADILETA